MQAACSGSLRRVGDEARKTDGGKHGTENTTQHPGCLSSAGGTLVAELGDPSYAGFVDFFTEMPYWGYRREQN